MWSAIKTIIIVFVAVLGLLVLGAVLDGYATTHQQKQEQL